MIREMDCAGANGDSIVEICLLGSCWCLLQSPVAAALALKSLMFHEDDKRRYSKSVVILEFCFDFFFWDQNNCNSYFRWNVFWKLFYTQFCGQNILYNPTFFKLLSILLNLYLQSNYLRLDWAPAQLHHVLYVTIFTLPYHKPWTRRSLDLAYIRTALWILLSFGVWSPSFDQVHKVYWLDSWLISIWSD